MTSPAMYTARVLVGVAVALAVIVVLVGCSTVPRTPDQTVYATYGAYITVAETTADLLEQGSITVEQARDIQSELADVRPKIDMAREIVSSGGDITGDRLARLKAIQAALLAIQKELMEAQS